MPKYRDFVIVTSDERATRMGYEIYKKTRNVVDAAVVAMLTLSLTRFHICGIGSFGGFAFIDLHETGKRIVLDYNTRSPRNILRDSFKYLYETFSGWKVENDENEIGVKAICVPSALAGLNRLAEDYCSLSFGELLDKILASLKTYSIDELLYNDIIKNYSNLSKSKEIIKWLEAKGKIRVGLEINFKGLYKFLDTIAKEGVTELYEGSIGDEITKSLSKRGSPLTFEDLQRYSPTLEKPLELEIGEYTVSTLRDCSGGVSVLQSVGAFDYLEVPKEKLTSPELLAQLIKLQREIWRTRLEELGDPYYMKYTYEDLLSDPYLRHLADRVLTIKPRVEEIKSQHVRVISSHVVVANSKGDVVCIVQSMRSPFGSYVFVPQYQFLLNNAIGFFEPKGNRPNSLAPWKKPLTDFCPVVIRKNDEPDLIISATGGRSMINITAFTLIAYLYFSYNLDKLISIPTFHVLAKGPIVLHHNFDYRVERKRIRYWIFNTLSLESFICSLELFEIISMSS